MNIFVGDVIIFISAMMFGFALGAHYQYNKFKNLMVAAEKLRDNSVLTMNMLFGMTDADFEMVKEQAHAVATESTLFVKDAMKELNAHVGIHNG